jgi:hypothetical protein
MNSWKTLLLSKKFRVALITFVIMTLNQIFDLKISVEESLVIVSPFIAYILGQGIADTKKEKES